MSKQKVSEKRLQEKNAKRAAHFNLYYRPGNASKLRWVHLAAVKKDAIGIDPIFWMG